jgi:hypothetical protein
MGDFAITKPSKTSWPSARCPTSDKQGSRSATRSKTSSSTKQESMSPFRITGYTHSTPEFERLEQLNKELVEVVELYLKWINAVEDPSDTTLKERHDLCIQLRNKAHGTLAKVRSKV